MTGVWVVVHTGGFLLMGLGGFVGAWTGWRASRQLKLERSHLCEVGAAIYYLATTPGSEEALRSDLMGIVDRIGFPSDG